MAMSTPHMIANVRFGGSLFVMYSLCMAWIVTSRTKRGRNIACCFVVRESLEYVSEGLRPHLCGLVVI